MISQDQLKKLVTSIVADEFPEEEKTYQASADAMAKDLFDEKEVPVDVEKEKSLALLKASYLGAKAISTQLEDEEANTDATIVSAELRNINNLWVQELIKIGFSQERSESIVDKYSFDLIMYLED